MFARNQTQLMLPQDNVITSFLCKKLGHNHLRIAGEYWHIEKLVALQCMILKEAPNLQEGLLWWSKSVSLFDRRLYVTFQHGDAQTHLQVECRTADMPSWAESVFDLLKMQLELLGLSKSIQVQVHASNPLVADVFLEEARDSKASSSVFDLVKHVYLLLSHQPIEQPELLSVLNALFIKNSNYALKLEQAAWQLGVSKRTLQRRLQEKQMSYSQCVDFAKRKQALTLLADTQLTTQQIAYQLGYEEPSNFHRTFRRWYPFSPMQYRQQCLDNRTQLNQQPIRLYYAKANTFDDNHIDQPVGKIWMEVDNIAFEKVVSVECRDRDGAWRRYPAFFERFLSHGTELWATTELPVAHPLTFRLCYEVDGKRYIENNHQRDYVVSKGLLIGATEYIVPTRQLINIGAQYTLFIELACRLENVARIDCYADDDPTPHAMRLTKHSLHYACWVLQLSLTQTAKQCRFRLYDESDNELAKEHYPIQYPIVQPLN
ncbi:helix-turn-helix transcriptional regulator [Vibrio parahaemolyticus]|uniref:helix-turn-helix transcriptional regulator n=1 Tax=Vibrio parahaemolyticus TaxID=670 RepID=UPI001B839127|nr:AraC family transcriptional regulator [Vibrio parahaemolyticus]MDF5074002.1 helix-turn-helix transcriptional regulator [Vibrio parahaemolyticus]MDF5410684.1 helix-turn-helix transcriptional regulator [Vibrio parahaemolyticus]MDF5420893.1 helix-turn-helix transcriptional regulator [Vibrio parahaemolyticus]MDF5479935.1 helix-turn-helix transcriptional regulator [Vibrio parahaemolyticus]HBC3859816.1 helix-turn-helix domain-containing protein [Vibrio parahaemolyticus]